jgi:hypothetical protein
MTALVLNKLTKVLIRLENERQRREKSLDEIKAKEAEVKRQLQEALSKGVPRR